jgi:hypothetical protein
MLPLDDVFEVHAWSNNSAVPRFPRMPTTTTGNPHTKAPFAPPYKDCAVTDPPSLSLTDSYFALARGDECEYPPAARVSPPPYPLRVHLRGRNLTLTCAGQTRWSGRSTQATQAAPITSASS